MLEKIVEKIKKRELSGEEKENLKNLEEELVYPTVKWTVPGFILIFFLITYAENSIGIAMILLSLYLVLGLLKFRRESNEKLIQLKNRISQAKILFATNMMDRVKNQLIVFSLVCLFFVIYLVIGIHINGQFTRFSQRCIEIWQRLSPATVIDVVAIIFSFLISAVAVVLAILKVSQISNLVITEEGLFISDSFLSWSEVKDARVEYFFRRPVDLVIDTKGGSVIRIQLSRFKIDREKAEEIAGILNRYVMENEQVSQ